MRYIGGKTNLVNDINDIIIRKTNNVNTIIDIFSGSGIVSSFLKKKEYNVIGNDIMYFSYVLSRGTAALNQSPLFTNLGITNPIEFLNNLTIQDTNINIDDCFIYQNYSPHHNVSRMYFQNDNAIKIDIIRMTIESWYKDKLINDDEYYYLLSSLISAVPYISNITGVYGAYLKHWDARTYNQLTLKAPEIIINNSNVTFYNENCDTLLPNITGDILYADPPYNSRQYLPNYHILETIARYDTPTIHGITGMRSYQSQKSEFCTKKGVENAFRRLIENANVRYILISYNNEGLLSTDKLSAICQEYSVRNTFFLHEIEYRRYSNAGANPRCVIEQLYFFEKQGGGAC